MRRNSSLLERWGLERWGLRERRRRTDPGDLALAALAGIGIGALSFYLVDPYRGRERRARLRDKTLHSFRQAAASSRATGRDLKQRAQGLAARAKGLFEREEVSDDVLVERIRSDMGRLVSHPHSIDVTAEDGRVTLSGLILSTEVQRFVRHVKRFPGVCEVDNQLEVHTPAENVPELQGGVTPAWSRRRLWRENWPPATRLLVGSMGLCALGYGTAGSTFGRSALCMLGTLATWRALRNEPVHGGRTRSNGREPAERDEAYERREEALTVG